ncbi:MAG: SCO family protein [bacterium]
MTPAETRNRNIRYTVIAVLAFVSLLLGGFIYKMTQPRILGEHELSANGVIVLKTPRRPSDFALVDQTSNTFDRSRLQGKWSLVFFGFTNCPDICPTTLSTLTKMYSDLDDRERQKLQLILVSLDPERDTPEVLAQYVGYFHPDVIGVTGNPYVTLKLATELNVAYTKVDLGGGNYTVDHTGNVLLFNPYGDYHAVFRPPFETGSMMVGLRSVQYHFDP